MLARLLLLKVIVALTLSCAALRTSPKDQLEPKVAPGRCCPFRGAPWSYAAARARHTVPLHPRPGPSGRAGTHAQGLTGVTSRHTVGGHEGRRPVAAVARASRLTEDGSRAGGGK